MMYYFGHLGNKMIGGTIGREKGGFRSLRNGSAPVDPAGEAKGLLLPAQKPEMILTIFRCLASIKASNSWVFWGDAMLTARQREFLQAVVQMSGKAEGVHYTEVARKLGVSKWTAYDVLCSLEERGYLERAHQVCGEGAGCGRSRLLFLPSKLALTYADSGPPMEYPAAGWEGVRQSLLERAQAGQHRVGELLKELLQEVEHIRQPFFVCAYLLSGVLLAWKLVNQAGDQQVLANYLLPLLSGPNAPLAAVFGSLVGLMLQHQAGKQAADTVYRYVPLFEERMRQLDETGNQELRHFVAAMVNRIWPELTAAGQ